MDIAPDERAAFFERPCSQQALHAVELGRDPLPQIRHGRQLHLRRCRLQIELDLAPFLGQLCRLLVQPERVRGRCVYGLQMPT